MAFAALGGAEARLTLDISDMIANAGAAESRMTQLDGAIGGATKGANTFKQGMLGLGTALIAPWAMGIKGAADMEQGMANINASLGGLDTAKLEELEQGFLDIGAASQFSAVEVAAVGDEIAKAGFEPDKIVGMTQATVDLSQATGTDLITSVSGITAAMQLWSPAIVDSTIALTDASRAADIFTVAANASSASVPDIIAGVRNLGPMAASIGIPFEDTAGSIALFTNYGLKAADSGISLTRAIENLQHPTSEGAALMDQYGISLFDLQGNFVGLPALFDQLHAAFGDMDPAARSAALSTLFNAEALDVMTIAAMTGGDPLRAITGQMDESGIAAEQSALRMNTLKAQFGELWESTQNFLMGLMGGVIPGLRLLVDAGNQVVNVLERIPGPIKTIIGVAGGLLAAIAAVTRFVQLNQALNMMLGGGSLFAGLGAIAPLLLTIAAAAGVAYAAVRFNLFGIGDAIAKFTSIWNNLADSAANNPISRFLIALGQALQTFDVALLDTIGRKLDQLGKKLNGFMEHFREAWDFVFGSGDDAEKDAKKQDGALGILQAGYDHLQDSLGDTVDPMDKVRNAARRLINPTADVSDAVGNAAGNTETLEDAMQRAAVPTTRLGRVLYVVGQGLRGADMPGFANAVVGLAFNVDQLATNFQYFREQGLNPVEAGLMSLGLTFPRIQTAMIGLYGVVDGLGDAFGAAMRGDWAGAFDGLAQAARSAWVVIQEIAGGIGGIVVDLWNWTINTGVPAVTGWIADHAGDIWSGIKTIAGWTWDGLVQLGSITLQIAGWLIQSAQSAWEAIKNWVLGHAGSGVSGAALGTGGQLASMTGSSIPIGAVAVVIGGWIVSAAESLIEKIDTFIFGEAGDREFEIPVINVTIGRVHVLPFGDKIQEGIDTAVRVWQTAQAVHADIEQINARVNSAKVEGGGGGGGGGFIGYLQSEIQKEIDHASKTWKFIVDLSIVAQAEVENPDSTYNDVVGLLERLAGGWGMIHGGEVDWSFILGEPEVLGFGLLDAAAWFDQHVYGPIEAGFNSIKDKFTFDILDITINWPSPPEAPGWLKKLFTDPVGWLKDEVSVSGSGDGGSGMFGPEVPEGFKWQGTLIDFGPGEGPTLDDLRGVINSIMGVGRSLIQSKSAEWGMALQTGTANLGTRVSAGLLGTQMAVTQSMTTIGTAIGTSAAQWGTNLNTGIQAMTLTSSTAMLGLQMGISLSMMTIGMTISTSAATWATSLTTGMAGMTAGATSAMATIGAVIQGGMAIATAAVTAGGAAMASAMASAGAAMSSAAASAAATTASVLQAGMAIATAAVASAAGQWPGIIAAAGGAMYSAGYGVGAAAGQGVVAGLLSMLGAVMAAAAAISNAVMGAMAAAALIASPSKITTYYGEMMGMGPVVGLKRTQGRAARAGRSYMTAMLGAMTPNAAWTAPGQRSYATPAGGGGGGVRIQRVEVNTREVMTDSEKLELTMQIATAMRTANDVVYYGHGVTPS